MIFENTGGSFFEVQSARSTAGACLRYMACGETFPRDDGLVLALFNHLHPFFGGEFDLKGIGRVDCGADPEYEGG